MTPNKGRARKAQPAETTTEAYPSFAPVTQSMTPESAREFASQALDRTKVGFEQYVSMAGATADLFAESYKAAA